VKTLNSLSWVQRLNLRHCQNLVWVTEKRSLFSFLFLFCSFLQGKTILEIKRITSEQFLEKKFHFFLKMCLNIISFSRFSGKSTIFSFGRLCQRLKKLFIFSSKEAEIIKIHFFKKKLFLLFGAMSSRIFNLLCVKINSSQKIS